MKAVQQTRTTYRKTHKNAGNSGNSGKKRSNGTKTRRA